MYHNLYHIDINLCCSPLIYVYFSSKTMFLCLKSHRNVIFGFIIFYLIQQILPCFCVKSHFHVVLSIHVLVRRAFFRRPFLLKMWFLISPYLSFLMYVLWCWSITIMQLQDLGLSGIGNLSLHMFCPYAYVFYLS